MKSLIIRSPHIERIITGEKTWEIRGSRTHIRGEIGLIKSGSGQIIGKANLIDCIELDEKTFKENKNKHLSEGTDYKQVYAWVLENARPIEPIPYKHPIGAVIWVNT